MKSRFFIAGFCALAILATGSAFADPLAAKRFVPQRHSNGICIDTPLSITFNQPPVLGGAGTIRVFRSDKALVDIIDLADPDSAKRPIGGATAGG